MIDMRKRSGTVVRAANQARSDADAVVARIPSATDFMKDNVWQWAFNESMAGRLSKIKHIWIARLDSTSAYIDLITGNVATDNGVGTHVAQDGISLASRQLVRMGVDLTAEYASPLDWSMGIYVSAAAHGAGNHGLIMNNNGASTARYISQNASGQIGGVYSGGTAGYITGTTQSDWLSKIIQGSGSEDGIDVQTLNNSGEDLGNNFGDFSQPDIYINSDNAANNGTMTFGMAYVADSDINFTGFATNTEALMSSLARTAPAFSNYMEDGDSLQDGLTAEFVGITDVIDPQPASINSDGGKLLQEVATDFLTNSNASTFDDAFIGGGTNDIRGPNEASYATMQGRVDSILSDFESQRDAGNLKEMIFRTIPPFAGTYLPGYWTSAIQTVLEQTNAYIVQRCGEVDGAHAVDIYPLLESPYLREHLKGAYYSDGFSNPPDAYTNPNDPAYSYDAIHLTSEGANAAAGLIEAKIRELRYYKGGRA